MSKNVLMSSLKENHFSHLGSLFTDKQLTVLFKFRRVHLSCQWQNDNMETQTHDTAGMYHSDRNLWQSNGVKWPHWGPHFVYMELQVDICQCIRVGNRYTVYMTTGQVD